MNWSRSATTTILQMPFPSITLHVFVASAIRSEEAFATEIGTLGGMMARVRVV